MKVCAYCNSKNDDNATSCVKCNASEFHNICNNCQTVFDTGFCPTCGTRAGETAKTCPNCGTKTFSAFCPACGTSLSANVSTRGTSAPSTPTNIVVNLNPQQQLPVAVPPKQGNGKIITLTIFFPFVCAWIILFSPKYENEKGLRIFALVYSAVMSVASIGSGSIQVLPLMIAPVIGYGIKVLVNKAKEKKTMKQKV